MHSGAPAATRPPLLHFIVATPPGELDEIVGFAAAEYYPSEQLRVALVHRGRAEQTECARSATASSSSRSTFSAPTRAPPGTGSRRCSARSTIPAKVEPGDDSMAPLDRLRVMDALGARRVPIPYVQPPLSEERRARSDADARRVPDRRAPGGVAGVDPSCATSWESSTTSSRFPTCSATSTSRAHSSRLQDDTLDLMRLVPREHPTFVDDTDGPGGAMHDYGVAIHLVLEPSGSASRSLRRERPTRISSRPTPTRPLVRRGHPRVRGSVSHDRRDRFGAVLHVDGRGARGMGVRLGLVPGRGDVPLGGTPRAAALRGARRRARAARARAAADASVPAPRLAHRLRAQRALRPAPRARAGPRRPGRLRR